LRLHKRVYSVSVIGGHNKVMQLGKFEKFAATKRPYLGKKIRYEGTNEWINVGNWCIMKDSIVTQIEWLKEWLSRKLLISEIGVSSAFAMPKH